MKVDSADSDFIWAVACREIAGKQEIISGDNEGHLRSHTVAYSRQGSKFNIENYLKRYTRDPNSSPHVDFGHRGHISGPSLRLLTNGRLIICPAAFVVNFRKRPKIPILNRVSDSEKRSFSRKISVSSQIFGFLQNLSFAVTTAITPIYPKSLGVNDRYNINHWKIY